MKYRGLYKALSALASAATLLSSLGSVFLWLRGYGAFYGLMAIIWFMAFLWSLREFKEARRQK